MLAQTIAIFKNNDNDTTTSTTTTTTNKKIIIKPMSGLRIDINKKSPDLVNKRVNFIFRNSKRTLRKYRFYDDLYYVHYYYIYYYYYHYYYYYYYIIIIIIIIIAKIINIKVKIKFYHCLLRKEKNMVRIFLVVSQFPCRSVSLRTRRWRSPAHAK
jgi:hypothetical protein